MGVFCPPKKQDFGEFYPPYLSLQDMYIVINHLAKSGQLTLQIRVLQIFLQKILSLPKCWLLAYYKVENKFFEKFLRNNLED